MLNAEFIHLAFIVAGGAYLINRSSEVDFDLDNDAVAFIMAAMCLIANTVALVAA
jgi:NADH:ubiquinone oxidoreductase subunit 5 (subunit L)/multisubunit Na+/H+ antiporter MnhA subunit